MAEFSAWRESEAGGEGPPGVEAAFQRCDGAPRAGRYLKGDDRRAAGPSEEGTDGSEGKRLLRRGVPLLGAASRGAVRG